MKRLLEMIVYVPALLVALSAQAARDGVSNGGGGQPVEIKFQEVATNIQQWIEAGNSVELNLKPNQTHDLYKSQMLYQLRNYVVTMTSEVILVNNEEKACVNFLREGRKSLIRCNRIQIEHFSQVTKSDELYRLIHHEFAVLAKIEQNQNEESDYFVSAQISHYMKEETVRRLPISRESANNNRAPRIRLSEASCPSAAVVDEKIYLNQFDASVVTRSKPECLGGCTTQPKELYLSIFEAGGYDNPVIAGCGKITDYVELISIDEKRTVPDSFGNSYKTIEVVVKRKKLSPRSAGTPSLETALIRVTRKSNYESRVDDFFTEEAVRQ